LHVVHADAQLVEDHGEERARLIGVGGDAHRCPRGGRGGQVHELERRDGLRDAVLEQFEIGGGQARRGLTISPRRDDVDSDELGGGLKPGLGWRGLSSGDPRTKPPP
jgi:hypothetical protein